ncbi:hypothetical protein E1A91_D02G010300v1 [Gossypium mustelinum]|uniref:Uncharacterized protein n=1 Tax=Gossypium mustelinum TaxID=34275 RepID=A0A5D2VQQ9_GOSMU|nr:hypothetical protein E1A91_D02G010300v1 [Gossypium mustelinum]
MDMNDSLTYRLRSKYIDRKDGDGRNVEVPSLPFSYSQTG